MSTTFATRPTSAPPDGDTSFSHLVRDPTQQAFWLLRVGFFLLPVAFGIDKFFNGMTFWPQYLWAGFPHFLSVSPQHFMYVVGGIEIAAGILVLLKPRVAPYVVAGWLAGIITNLVIISAAPGHVAYWDIALRDFGLLVAALALGRLAAGVQSKSARRLGRHLS
ncbi:MAG TPA: hypothetical protein VIC86_03500 [Acidimicrobiales bacterium]|jgi:uncharacterized membrane protein YphA (DoxX/SURF4 family)